MATTSKLSFRARNLDANRGMKVFFADELPDISECAPIARGVNPMPTGMEKEEEMETHLQNAIHAQQASTSGISDNHVIPTPKVLYIDDVRYDEAYPVQPPCKTQLMKVQAWLSMEREEAEYDMDSEDEEYLTDKPHINARDLERIMEQLEAQSSESAICQPATARKVLMPHFDDNVIDDVYDYWLSKRKEAATKKIIGFGGLIPRIRTECRKENEKLNPYVAFRRRAEKMQTRKNRKNDEDSYEKVLRLGHDLRRAVHLFEMVKRREKSKLAMIDLDVEILSARAQLGDYGSVVYSQILAKLQPDEEDTTTMTSPESTRVPHNGAAAAAEDTALQPLRGEENGVKRKKPRKRVSSLRSTLMSSTFDRELPNKTWLKKNAEIWNQSPQSFISGMHNYSPAVEQVDQSVAAANTANADGRYAFKRRRGCQYRPATSLGGDKNGNAPRLDSIPPERRFYYVSMPSTSKDCATITKGGASDAALPSQPRHKTLLRRRMGRGGRVVFDQFPQPSRQLPGSGSTAPAAAAPQRSNYVAGRRNTVIYDPFELDCAAIESEETSKWEARPRHSIIESEDEDDPFHPISSRHLLSSRHRSYWKAEDEEADAVAEAAWLASAVSPSPSPEPRANPAPSNHETEEEAPPEKKQQEDVEMEEVHPTKPCDSTDGPSPPSEHEDSVTTATTTPQTPSMKEDSRDHLSSDVIDHVSGKVNGAATAAATGAAGVRSHQAHSSNEESTMDEEGGSASSSATDSPSQGRPIEDSPTSSSEHDHDHHNHHLLPLGEGAGPVHQLHLASGNASVLSPPDSTTPSPRVSNGCSNGVSSSLVPAPSVASLAPHSNEHNGHDGSGNGVASGYEAAATAATLQQQHYHLGGADAWRMRAKLVTMEAVASRLTRVKDPDASSRESGCSPTEKSLPSPVDADEGVVMQLEPWEPSNSPSESNSSSDWTHTPPASTRTSGDVAARLTAYATLSSEEETGARTGDHPTLPAKPSRKQSGAVNVHQMGGIQRPFTLAAATTPSPIV